MQPPIHPKMVSRAQWPHTVEDIHKALDGVWGLIGATGTSGNLFRLERSLHEPTFYTLTEYRETNESDVVRREEYGAADKQNAIDAFAKELGF
jgi:hypothetical protein